MRDKRVLIIGIIAVVLILFLVMSNRGSSITPLSSISSINGTQSPQIERDSPNLPFWQNR